MLLLLAMCCLLVSLWAGRETQDFASLQAGAIIFLNEKHYTYSCTGSSPLSAPRALYASDSISPSPGITVTGDAQLYMPMGDLIDFAAERARIEKAVAKAENIEATEEDKTEFLNKLASDYGAEAEKIKDMIDENLMVQDIVRRKAADVLYSTAVKTEPKPEEEAAGSGEEAAPTEEAPAE